MREDKYEFEIGEKGQEGLDILDAMFNPNTKQAILSVIKPGMKVLDIGCGRGAMSVWLANQVGESGKVVAIDNSENQINATIALTKETAPSWLNFKVLSAYDIDSLNEPFDMVYCRFILHHINNPTQVIEKAYHLLHKGGFYVAEEGIVSAAFSYPKVLAWGAERTEDRYPREKEGEDRDGNFGMKLFHQMKTVGFEVLHAGLYQPLLYTHEQKQLLAGPSREGYKEYALAHGVSVQEWEKRAKALDDLIANPAGCIGFYQSCLVVAKK
ncbi:MAG: class I SAM-dependent methyltransferase [Candidatus Berkiella sp.]